MIIVDASGLILGRLASFVAKQALMGEQVHVVNCEKAVISGNRKDVMQNYTGKLHIGQPITGPFFYRRESMFVKRTIRGMLPHKMPKGRAAFKNIRCHIGIPEDLRNKQFETIEKAKVTKLQSLKYLPVSKICRELR